MIVDLPPLYPAQERAIFTPARAAFIEGSTKSGKTAGCLTWLLAQALSTRGVHWWVAPVYPQARMAYERAKRDYAGLLVGHHDTEVRLDLINGSQLWFKSAEKPDNLYGHEVSSVVIDEASRCREESYTAVRSTLTTTRGPLRAIGNVRGRGNWFFRKCRQAEAGSGDHYAILTAADAVEGGVLHPDELVEAARDLPHSVYRELYFCEPGDGAHNPFGLDAISRAVQPLSTSPAVVYGLDLARAQDWTVLVGLDATGAVCHLDRWQSDWTATYDRVQATVGRAPVLVDATGIGDPICNELEQRRLNVTRYLFSQSSKQVLMQALRLALAEGRTTVTEGPHRVELEAFEYTYSMTGGVRYSAPSGWHDDCVMAHALAVHHGQTLCLTTRHVVPAVAPVLVAGRHRAPLPRRRA